MEYIIDGPDRPIDKPWEDSQAQRMISENEDLRRNLRMLLGVVRRYLRGKIPVMSLTDAVRKIEGDGG
jgi:hypothetical protein